MKVSLCLILFWALFTSRLVLAGSISKRATKDRTTGDQLLIGGFRTKFVCSNNGIYADQDNFCKIFHICHSIVYPDGTHKILKLSFLCENKTVFNQFSLTCSSPEDAVPCERARDFWYLNANLGGEPNALFHNDQDVSMQTAVTREGDVHLLKPQFISETSKHLPPSWTSVIPSPPSLPAWPPSPSTEVWSPSSNTSVWPSSPSLPAWPPPPSTAVWPPPSSRALRPSPHSTAVRPSSHSAAVRPSSHSAAVRPSSLSTAVRPSHHSTAVRPSPHSTAVRPPSPPRTFVRPPPPSTAVQSPHPSTAVGSPPTWIPFYPRSTRPPTSVSRVNLQSINPRLPVILNRPKRILV